MEISAIIKVTFSTSQEIKYIILGSELIILNENLYKNNYTDSSSFSFIAKNSNTVICCEVPSLLRKCVKIDYEYDKVLVIPVVNKFETD